VHTPFEVKVPVRAQSRLRPLIGATRYAELEQTGSRARAVLGGITVWNVSSTADGGGVAEMLHVLVGYILTPASTSGGSFSAGTRSSSGSPSGSTTDCTDSA